MLLVLGGENWTNFTQAFMGRYFTNTYKVIKSWKFANLRERAMTIEEYAHKFTAFSQFTPFHVANKTEKAIQFKEGLQEDIKS